MQDPFFFGYGSLVNRDTHIYTPAHRARLRGWRRAWRHTQGRAVPFLTGVRCAESVIDGLVALVPGGDWAALDLREEGYDRHAIGAGLQVEGDHSVSAQIYAVADEKAVSLQEKPPILMSYLDVVVQGYLREFGEEGAVGFFDTTDGWDTPVLNDRAKPRYPRHQVLSAAEQDFVDQYLARLSVRVTTS